MRRSAVALLGAVALVLVSAGPVRAFGHRAHGHHGHGHAQPVMPVAPVSPFGFQQVLQGMQLIHGVNMLVGDLHSLRQGEQQGREQPAARCTVSQDVISTLNRVDTALDDIVSKTNALTKSVRDPKYPDLSKPIEVVKPGPASTTGASGEPIQIKKPTAKPPGKLPAESIDE